jgi:hypothetical protein
MLTSAKRRFCRLSLSIDDEWTVAARLALRWSANHGTKQPHSYSPSRQIKITRLLKFFQSEKMIPTGTATFFQLEVFARTSCCILPIRHKAAE